MLLTSAPLHAIINEEYHLQKRHGNDEKENDAREKRHFILNCDPFSAYRNHLTFVAPEAGIYELDFYFERDLYTTEELTTEAPEQTTEAKSTEAVTEATTEVQTQPKQEKSGCGAIMRAAMLPCLAIAVILIKKRRD